MARRVGRCLALQNFENLIVEISTYRHQTSHILSGSGNMTRWQWYKDGQGEKKEETP